MKKCIITLALLVPLCGTLLAQQTFKINKHTGKLHVQLPNAVIEGYKGNEIVITLKSPARKGQDPFREEDNRAKGLQALSSTGLRDNTGMGISVTETDQGVKLSSVASWGSGDKYVIRVPQQMDIVFNNERTISSDSLVIRNMKGELEVSTTYNTVILEDNSGPMNVKTVYRNIEGKFGNDLKGPVSLISVYGYVDMALPEKTKASLSMTTRYGKIYAAEAFNIAITPQPEKPASGLEPDTVFQRLMADSVFAKLGDVKPYARSMPAPPTVTVMQHGFAEAMSGVATDAVTVPVMVNAFEYRGAREEKVEGTTNGGGIPVILKSTYRNVYLRTR